MQQLVRHLAALPDGGAQLPTGSVLTPRCDGGETGPAGVALGTPSYRCAHAKHQMADKGGRAAVSSSCLLASCADADACSGIRQRLTCELMSGTDQDGRSVQHHACSLTGQPVCCVRGLQTLGLAALGMSSGFERLHYLLESAFDADGDLSPAFLKVRALWSSLNCRYGPR